jgi:hypothetical protein
MLPIENAGCDLLKMFHTARVDLSKATLVTQGRAVVTNVNESDNSDVILFDENEMPACDNSDR